MKIILQRRYPNKLISNKEDTLFDDINDEEIEQELSIQDQVEAIGEIMDELFEPSQPTQPSQLTQHSQGDKQLEPSSDSSSSGVLRLDEELSDSEISSDEDLPESVLSGKVDQEEIIQASIDAEGSTGTKDSKGSKDSSNDGSALRMSSAESSLADSEDFSMERLDDSSSDGGYKGSTCKNCKRRSCNGGCRGSTCRINQKNMISNQKGGYNVSRYYLNRLKKYDKEIFSKQNNIPRKNSYPVMCGAQYGRQPVAITKQMLDKYNETGEVKV